ncbi:DUF4397 domain-containing protein [Glaciihabitans sp. UYNi722]|uniref:DUF4397 domain-containing protein n=1 Tax=Glaciihabitans sp. UYNi722 TaxID=3156344 RepID=UPI0033955F61
MITSTVRRLSRTISIAAAVIAGLSLGVAPALADTAQVTVPITASTAGWIRLAHLSPDTDAVDVRVTAKGSRTVLLELDGVAYGAVSGYSALPAGRYTVTMTPSGAKRSTKPVITSSVVVTAGQSTTVAAFGRNVRLRMKAYPDDLASPAAGAARIRLLQASALTPVVSVVTSTGVAIATDARAGATTPYVEVPAGPWTLSIGGQKLKYSATVSLASGSVTTVVVLDTASGGLTARPILDSAAAAQTPVGAVQTGGGFLARTVKRTIRRGALSPADLHPYSQKKVTHGTA